MPNPNNPDIEINAPFIRFKQPNGTWTQDIDASLIKVVRRGSNNQPTTLSVESAVHGAVIIDILIDPIDIMSSISTARK